MSDLRGMRSFSQLNVLKNSQVCRIPDRGRCYRHTQKDNSFTFTALISNLPICFFCLRNVWHHPPLSSATLHLSEKGHGERSLLRRHSSNFSIGYIRRYFKHSVSGTPGGPKRTLSYVGRLRTSHALRELALYRDQR